MRPMAYGTVIIGNGVAGITAARHLRKNSNDRIQVISMEGRYFFSRTALMYVYMGHMKFDHIKPYEDWFWEKNKIELVQAQVERVNTEEKNLILNTGDEVRFDQLVIATGSRTKYFGWKGQDLKNVQGLITHQDLKLLERTTPRPFEKNHAVKNAVIVGAGLIGVELAEMLQTRGIRVSMLLREHVFWGNTLTEKEGACINQHLLAHGVDLLIAKDLDTINGDGKGAVRSITTKDGMEVDCQFVGICTGVTANIEFLENSGIEMDKGVLVDPYLQTNISGIYAAGDCAQLRQTSPRRKPLEPVWYVGKMMGETLGKTLSGKPTPYVPGPWFNSAKFFDIEYVTYGLVKSKPDSSQQHYFWKEKEHNRFITLAYDNTTKEFIGINSFGMRLRHEYFHNVLKRKMYVGEVVGGMKIANFDPEFYPGWHSIFQAHFEKTTGIAIKRPSKLKQLLLR